MSCAARPCGAGRGAHEEEGRGPRRGSSKEAPHLRKCRPRGARAGQPRRRSVSLRVASSFVATRQQLANVLFPGTAQTPMARAAAAGCDRAGARRPLKTASPPAGGAPPRRIPPRCAGGPAPPTKAASAGSLRTTTGRAQSPCRRPCRGSLRPARARQRQGAKQQKWRDPRDRTCLVRRELAQGHHCIAGGHVGSCQRVGVDHAAAAAVAARLAHVELVGDPRQRHAAACWLQRGARTRRFAEEVDRAHRLERVGGRGVLKRDEAEAAGASACVTAGFEAAKHAPRTLATRPWRGP